MEIAPRIRAYFSKSAVNAGLASFSAGRAEVVEEDAGSIRVRADDDGSAALAELAWTGKLLRATCTCSAFDSGYLPCGHIWAAVLIADARGLLGDLPASGPIRIGTWPGSSRIEDLASGEPTVPPGAGSPRRPAGGLPAAAILPSDSAEAEEPPRESITLPEAVEPGKHAKPERPTPLEIVYILDLEAASPSHPVVIEVMAVEKEHDGSPPEPVPPRLTPDVVQDRLVSRDRTLIRAMAGGAAGIDLGSWALGNEALPCRFALDPDLSSRILGPLAEINLHIRRAGAIDPKPVDWDDWPFWNLGLRIVRAEDGKDWLVCGFLFREGKSFDLREASLIVPGAYALVGRFLSYFYDHDIPSSFNPVRSGGELRVSADEDANLLDSLWNLRNPLPIEWPDDLRLREVHAIPEPRLTIRPALPGGDPRRLRAWLVFSYGGILWGNRRRGDWIIDLPRRRRIARNWEAERAASDRLSTLGFWWTLDRFDPNDPHDLDLITKRLPKAVRALTAEGWHVEAEGKLYRKPGKFRLFISSGMDWFDLEGEVDFDGKAAKIRDILKALRRGETMILLDDGTIGMLPEEWLERYGLLASLGTVEENAFRFLRSQAALLDALLREQEGARWDEGFERAREELRSFEGIAHADPPPTFTGTLRPYQRDGLGWLGFLRRFGFGGCLADDMGLGKTVQVLAHLEALRYASLADGERPRPSIVVVPRSLLFNWMAEAARFTPNLKVLEHHGPRRAREAGAIDSPQVILTTYSTLLSVISSRPSSPPTTASSAT